MDKLNELEFESDSNWSRLKLGTKELREKADNKYLKAFTILFGISTFRYIREVTYYKKNLMTTFGVILGFGLSSHFIAQAYAYDPHLIAAEKNNVNEQAFINSYLACIREAKQKGIEIPDDILY